MTYIILTIILVLFGIGLLLAEMFLLPGFGIAGIFGLASLIAAVVIAYMKLAVLWAWAGHVTLAACVVLCGIAIWVFLRSKALNKMALDTKIEGGVDMPSAGKHMEDLQKKPSPLHLTLYTLHFTPYTLHLSNLCATLALVLCESPFVCFRCKEP